ncbi:MAG: DUF4123 domain-containing protein [Zoogloeaceae bacterium]|jgi:hypothetical protein|nr:DUF4123 domain-containing protein [Zoogloeaceae bacterium]
MIPSTELRQALLKDMAPLPGSPAIRHLAAIIDVGRLSEEERGKVQRKLKKFQQQFLLAEPELQELAPVGAILVSCLPRDPLQHFQLLDDFCADSPDIISAWIASALPPQRMAEHLRQSTLAWDAQKRRYLLRYYDPLITPVLYRVSPVEWVRWFFGPMIAWWYAVATPEGECWSRLKGGAWLAETKPVPLVLTEELWEALMRDPLPYRLLHGLEEIAPEVFAGECYGVRLTRIEGLLEDARQRGLTKQNDLITYVMACARHPERHEDLRWQSAVQSAAAGLRPLDAYFG